MPAEATAPESPLARLGGAIEDDSSGVLGLLVVAAAGLTVSYVFWALFAQPLAIVSDILPEKTCAGEIPGTSGMRSCATQAGVLKMVGPIAFAVGIFIARRPLTRWTQALATKLPDGLRPLVAPMLATLLFLLMWAGTHKDSSDEVGLLPQKAFPALIGSYTYAVMRWGTELQRRLSGFLDLRDRLPFVARLVITLAVPTAVSFIITNQDRVSDSALKEQFVVVIGLSLAYLFLVPRGESVEAVATGLVRTEST